PADPEELARKTRCNLQYVSQCKPHCETLFELHNGRLYSNRMEAERKRSEQASKNASARYSRKTYAMGSAFGSANASAIGNAASDYDSDSKKKEKHSDSKVENRSDF